MAPQLTAISITDSSVDSWDLKSKQTHVDLQASVQNQDPVSNGTVVKRHKSSRFALRRRSLFSKKEKRMFAKAFFGFGTKSNWGTFSVEEDDLKRVDSAK